MPLMSTAELPASASGGKGAGGCTAKDGRICAHSGLRRKERTMHRRFCVFIMSIKVHLIDGPMYCLSLFFKTLS